MSQHDLEFADQFFPPMRVDMNAALIAISTRQSGPGAPPLVAAARPNRLFVHDVSGLVFVRDNADTTDYIWDTWGREKVRNVTLAADTLLALDMAGVVTYSNAGAVAVTVPQAIGNFAASWNTWIWNFGPGQVSLNPVTSQINGGSSLLLDAGVSAQLHSKGGQWWAFKSVSAAPPSVHIGALLPSFAPAVTGYVLLDGRTIGNATSGATSRADPDTWPLYDLLWNNVLNAWAPVAGGRGASSAADYAANKALGLPDASGAGIYGRDNMSGTIRGRVTVAGSGVDGTVLGLFGGSQRAQAHVHGVNDPGHFHYYGQGSNNAAFGSGVNSTAPPSSNPIATDVKGTGISIQTFGDGGNQNMGPGIFVNIFCKL